MRQKFTHPLLLFHGGGKIAELTQQLSKITVQIHVIRRCSQSVSIQSPGLLLCFGRHLGA